MKLETDVSLKPSFSSALTRNEQPEKVQPLAESEKEETKKAEGMSKEYLEEKIKDTNNFLEPSFTAVKFQLHEDLNRYYVEVVDQKTKEVVREIPPKDFLDMIAKMTEFLGVLIDKRI